MLGARSLEFELAFHPPRIGASAFCVAVRQFGDLFFEQRAIARGCLLVLIKFSFDRRDLLFGTLKGILFLMQRFGERRLMPMPEVRATSASI